MYRDAHNSLLGSDEMKSVLESNLQKVSKRNVAQGV